MSPSNGGIQHHDVHGYDEFCRFVDNLPSGGATAAAAAGDHETSASPPVYILFSGSKDANGVNWCPYCITAEPVVDEGLKLAPANSVFVHVTVGERDYWKDPLCPFRTDERTQLTWVPTLLRWQTALRLDSSRVSDPECVNALFSSHQ